MSELPDQFKALLRKTLPRDVHRLLQRGYHRLKYGRMNRAESFTHIYKTNNWGSQESRSGPGSSMERTVAIRQQLVEFIDELDCKTVIDLGCGDFNWMKHVVSDRIDYVGCDIVEELIKENNETHGSENVSFRQLDAVEAVPPKGDLLICREMLIHLSNDDSIRAIRNMVRSKSDVILLTHDDEVVNTNDIPSGSYRNINLCAPPFDLPQPDFCLSDSSSRNLAGWRVERLQFLLG